MSSFNALRGIIAVCAIGLLVPAAAQADWTVHHPSDPGWVTLDAQRDYVAICDGQPDTHWTYARYWNQGGPGEWLSTWPGRDGYGRDSQGRFCTGYHTTLGDPRTYEFAVCVQYEGCSRFYDIYCHGFCKKTKRFGVYNAHKTRLMRGL